jgi:hypothetical protein
VIAEAKRRKLLLGCLVAAIIGWTVWPYYAVYDLVVAVREGDISTLEDRVEWDSVRQSLRADIKANVLAAAKLNTNAPSAGLGAGRALMLAPAIIDGMIDSYVTPQGVAAIVRPTNKTDAGQTAVDSPKTLTQAVQAAAKGLDQVRYAFFSGGPLTFKVQIEAESKKPITLLFKWSGDWKLTRIVLPPNAFDGPKEIQSETRAEKAVPATAPKRTETEQAAAPVAPPPKLAEPVTAPPPKLAEPVTAPPPAPVYKDYPPPGQRIWVSPQ